MTELLLVLGLPGVLLVTLMAVLARRDRRGSWRTTDAHTRLSTTRNIHHHKLHARAAADLENKRHRGRN